MIDYRTQPDIVLAADLAIYEGTTSDEYAVVLAHELDVPADTIADDVAELFERLTIALDLAEDPEHALFIHYDETYHGGDMTALREHELDAARQAAERIAGKVPA